MFKFDNKSLLYKSHLFENEEEKPRYGKLIKENSNVKKIITPFIENSTTLKSLTEQGLHIALENNKIIEKRKLWLKLYPVKKYIEEFIKKKKIMIYGGIAINLALPKNKQFYNDDEIPDFDLYSLNAQKDAISLCDYIKKKTSNPYIFVKTARHEGTYKIFYEWDHLADITNIDNKLYYDRLQNLTKSLYNKKFNLAPIELLKYSFHFELSKPLSSSFRWEKIYDRLKRFDEVYADKKSDSLNKIRNIEKFLKPCDNDEIISVLNCIYNNILTKKRIIVGTMAYIKYFSYGETVVFNKLNNILKNNKFYSEYYNPNSGYLSILSIDPNKDCKIYTDIINKCIKNNLKNFVNYKLDIITYTGLDIKKPKLDNKTQEPLFDKYSITLKLKNKIYNLLTIHNATNTCYSVTIDNKNKIAMGTVDTVITFTYFNILNFPLKNYNNKYLVLPSILDYMIYNENEQNVKRTFDPICYGTEQTLYNIAKENWGKKNLNKKFKYVPGVKNPHKYI